MNNASHLNRTSKMIGVFSLFAFAFFLVPSLVFANPPQVVPVQKAVPIKSGTVIKPAPKPAAKPKPVINTNIPFEEVEIPAKDGFGLFGRLYDQTQRGEDEDKAPPPKEKLPLVILLHQLGSDSGSWGAMPYYLVKAGYAVLALDLRGHGKSIWTGRHERLTWRVFKDEDWLKMPKDVRQVQAFFKENAEDYPQINAASIAIVGTKLGANAALIAGSDMNIVAPGNVKSIVIVNANRGFRSLKTPDAAINLTAPLFVAASDGDTGTYADSQTLYKWAQGAKTLKLYHSDDSGTDLLKSQPDLVQGIIQWLKKTFPASSGK